MSPPTSPPVRTSFRRWRLPLLLAGALLLRVLLALQGGQYFFGDEDRYLRGIELYQAVRAGDSLHIRFALARPEHAAFDWAVAALAPLPHGLAYLQGQADWSDPSNLQASAPLCAATMSLFSVLTILLVHRLARRLGADEDGAFWAAALAAASNTLFYYSRHLLPYDVALACWLGGLVLTLRPGRGALIAGGVLTGFVYHLYNGYFALPVATWLWLASQGGPWRERLLRSLPWSAGAAIGLGVPWLVGTAAGGAAYWAVMRDFAGTVTQGLFAEGWSLPWEYFWHSEGWLGTAAAAAATVACMQGSSPARRIMLLAALAYAILVLASTWLESFVVYARTIRPLVPLFCIAGAAALQNFAKRQPRWAEIGPWLLVAGGLAQALPHYGRIFPRDVETAVQRDFGGTKRWVSFTGVIYRPFRTLRLYRRDLALADAQMLYPLRDWRGYPAGEVVAQFEHPLTYRPYQYEGHTPRERALLRDHPFTMRVIRLADPDSVPLHPPPNDVFTAADRPDGRDHGRPQP